MKIKALRGFVSSITSMEAGDVKEVDLDEPTYQHWTSIGLIEEVKEPPLSDAAGPDAVSPAPVVGNAAPEAVTPDENK